MLPYADIIAILRHYEAQAGYCNLRLNCVGDDAPSTTQFRVTLFQNGRLILTNGITDVVTAYPNIDAWIASLPEGAI